MFIAAIFIAFLFSAGAAAADDGDSEPPVPICVTQAYVNQYLDPDNPAGFEDPNGCYVLTESIDLIGLTWKPIGSDSGFSGTFDGAGFLVIGFSYDGGDRSAGFFKSVENASISNLTFIHPAVTGADASGAGILAGTSTGATTIENCTVISGSVRITGPDGGNAGGLIGLIEGEPSYIHQSDFNGNIENAGQNSGGLAGSAENLTVTESSAAGLINASGGHAGGLIGFIPESGNVSVSDSYFEGNIEAENMAGGMIGSVSLNAETNLFHSYSVSEISITSAGGKSGGLIGKTNNAGIEIKNSFYLGEIEDRLDNGLGIPVTKEELKTYDTFTVLEGADGVGYIRETPWDIGLKPDALKIWYVYEGDDYPRFSRNSAGGIILPEIDPPVDFPEVSAPASSKGTGYARVIETSSNDAADSFKPPYALDLAMEPLSYKGLYLILLVGFIIIVGSVTYRLDRKD